MNSRDSALFSATAFPAAIVSLVLTAVLAYRSSDSVSAHVVPLGALVAFAVLSYVLSFTTTGHERASLELAYFLAAAMVLPPPSALVVGTLAALAGSLLRGDRSAGPLRYLSVAAANISIAAAITGAASAAAGPVASAAGISLPAGVGGPAAPELLPLLFVTASLFAIMNVANLLVMGAWVGARRESVSVYGRHFLSRILPIEAINVPVGCLLAWLLAGPAGFEGFALLAILGVFMSLLLKGLGDSDDRLRRANLDLEERVIELAMLNAIGREISSSLDPQRVFETIRRECRKVFRPDFFWIARFEPETREISVDFSMAGDAPPRSLTIPAGKGIASHVIATEKPLLISDASRDPLIRELQPVILEPKIRSILAVPLMVERRVVGVLSVQSFRENAYAGQHVSLLITIAQQAAIALENARHYQRATVDQLTGLYQREYFLQKLNEEYVRSSRYGTPFSLLMLDLDCFKRINDKFGHLAGDRFLRALGAMIRSSLRTPDVPCRYGGEEFCVLLPETDLGGARAIAERLRQDIGALQVTEGTHFLGTTVSVGIASYPIHFEGSLASLMEKADQALLEAKGHGKDRVAVAGAFAPG